MLKKSDITFKIWSATLALLLLTGLIHRFTYTNFSLIKAGQVFWYNWDLWKQYFSWLPGKILCITFAVLVFSLIAESIFLIFRSKK